MSSGTQLKLFYSIAPGLIVFRKPFIDIVPHNLNLRHYEVAKLKQTKYETTETVSSFLVQLEPVTLYIYLKFPELTDSHPHKTNSPTSAGSIATNFQVQSTRNFFRVTLFQRNYTLRDLCVFFFVKTPNFIRSREMFSKFGGHFSSECAVLEVIKRPRSGECIFYKSNFHFTFRHCKVRWILYFYCILYI